jgi:hypothetical protein
VRGDERVRLEHRRDGREFDDRFVIVMLDAVVVGVMVGRHGFDAPGRPAGQACPKLKRVLLSSS